MEKLNLIFNEYIKFLIDKGLDNQKYNLKEGYYWLDNQIIKAYDKEGNIHKILRLKVDDNLNITFKDYKKENFKIESWNDTVERNKEYLIQLEKDSIKLIHEQNNMYKTHRKACLTSGGKDSSVVNYLVDKAIGQHEVIFNNTTLDCADTYKHIKKIDDIKIINPKEGFYQWRERNNFVGNRMSRACCTIFKEGAMINVLNKNDKYLFFMGMRNEESNTRSSYGDIWINEKWKPRDWIGILPIRKWTEIDVWLYILFRNIDVNSKYKKGYSRVGCAISCPYYSKSTWVLDKYWYKNMYDRWHDILTKDFIDNKKASIMNCTLKEYHICWNGGTYRDEATEEVIREFSKQQGLDIEIARKYFNKKCTCCNKKLKKNDIALSMKFYGRQIEKFKCIKCLAEDLGVTQKHLRERAKEFKQTGCDLF